MIKKLLATLALLCACGAPDDDLRVGSEPLAYEYAEVPGVLVPGQENRIDGSPWLDGIFNDETSKAEFCAEYGDLDEAWFCDDMGTTEQAFTSVIYHGITTDGVGACYGPAQSILRDCAFPKQKTFRVAIDPSACTGLSTADRDVVLIALKEGIKLWNGKGQVKVVDNTADPSILVTIKCSTSPGGNPNALAFGALSGTPTNRGDLPVMPSGSAAQRNPRNALVIPGAVFQVNPVKLLNFVNNTCTGGAVKVMTMRYVGTHEMGHILGFAHFNSAASNNVMFSTVNCKSSITFHSGFASALDVFNPASGTPGTINAETLTGLQPR